MSRLAYFTRETLISLRRNLLMTFAGVMTVSVSLFLFGGILLVSRVVDHGTSKWKHGVELEIFMKVKASDRQIKAVKDSLDADKRSGAPRVEEVKSYRFLTKDDALQGVPEALPGRAGARGEHHRGRRSRRRSGSCRASRS